MPRADLNYPSVYLGRPGSLVTLPYPRGDQDRPYERPVADFQTGFGQHIVSSLATGSRLRTVNWNALHVDNYAKVEQFWTGMMGQGPWAYIDPANTNMLLPNQASATNLYGDARTMTVSLGAISSQALSSFIHRAGATRSLRWLFAAAPGATTPTLSFTAPYRSWYGFPAVPGLSYAFSCWMRPDGTVDTDITASVRINWMDAAGATLSTTSSGDLATGNAWVRRSAVGVAPAGTAYARPTVVVTGSTVLAGASLYLDELLLEQDSVVNDWAPGVGTKAVEILDLSDISPFNARFRQAVTLSLREVAP